MKLLKIIGVIVLIYFIRRFIQMYKVMKEIQKQQMAQKPMNKEAGAINAEYKVVD